MENSGKSALGLDPNVAAGLAYLPICLVNLIVSIIIVATDKTNRFARFAAFQSLILIGLFIVGYILGMVVVFAGAAGNSTLITLLGSAIYLLSFGIFFICSIIGCIMGFMGKEFRLPVIGGMADKWS